MAVLAVKVHVRVILGVLQEALRPARALAQQRAHGVGHRGVHVGRMRIADLEPVRMHAERYLHVLGIVRMAEGSYCFKYLALVKRERPGQDRYGRQVVEHLLKEYAEGVLHRLHDLQEPAGALDLHGRSNSHNAGVVLGLFYNLDKRVAGHERVRVEAAHKLGTRALYGVVKRGPLAAVCLAVVGNLRVRCGIPRGYGGRAVFRAVVYHHNIELVLWVLQAQKRVERAPQSALLVPHRDHYIHRGVALGHQKRLFIWLSFKERNQQKYLEIEGKKERYIYA